MALSPEIELGLEIVKVLGIFGGGAVVLLKLGKMAGRFEESNAYQANQIGDIKREMRDMNDTVTAVAVQKNEIANIHEDITRLTRWYEELRRGTGYIGKTE